MSETERSTRGWPPPAVPTGSDLVVLDKPCHDGLDPTLDLSAAAREGDTLFLGSDEGAFIERLRRGAPGVWDGHRCFALSELLGIASSEEEADIEGLAIDGPWLWLLGSHARTRHKLEKDGADRIDIDRFAELKDTRPRCLLARLPLGPDPDAPGILAPLAREGKRRAGMLRQTVRGNALARRMGRHRLLKPFLRIGAKEGGVDLEGLAVAGNRVAIGMRGPVIQTYAVMLEMRLEAKRSGRLAIDGPLHLRLLELGGLGIRDLKRDGDDLLILAGPATGLDGPCAVHRWRNWLNEPSEDDEVGRLHRPERILDLPFGRGDDHPEGLVVMESEAGRKELMVICDSPSPERRDGARRSVRCDRFAL